MILFEALAVVCYCFCERELCVTMHEITRSESFWRIKRLGLRFAVTQAWKPGELLLRTGEVPWCGRNVVRSKLNESVEYHQPSHMFSYLKTEAVWKTERTWRCCDCR